MASSLETAAKEANEPALLLYIINRLGAGVPRNSHFFQSIQKTRRDLFTHLLRLYVDPVGTQRMTLLKDHPQLARSLKAQQQLWNAQAKLQLGAALKKQFDAALRRQADQAIKMDEWHREVLAPLAKEIAARSLDAIKDKLNDEQPMIRWLAIQ